MPLKLKLERRDVPPSLGLNFGMRLLAILGSFAAITIFILLLGANPLDAYRGLFEGSVGTYFNLAETLVKATPLILTSMAVIIAFKSGVWNIGGEGQLVLGAIFATVAGIYFQTYGALQILLIMLAGLAGGALFILGPALLKAKLGVNEIVTTVMLNSIAAYILSFLINGPLKDPTATTPQSLPIAASAHFLRLVPGTRINIGLLLAIAAAIIVYILFWKTSFGYKLKSVGLNPKASNCAGIDIPRVTLIAMLISGMFAGLAGAGEVAGIQYRLRLDISSGYGLLGIPIAYLSGLHPIVTIPMSIFFAAMENGAEAMYREAGVPTAVAQVFEALAFIFLLIGMVLVNYRIRREK